MSIFTKKLICIDSDNKALVQNATYLLVAEVEQGHTFVNGEHLAVKGLIVMEQGSSRALPYVYNRTRFEAI